MKKLEHYLEIFVFNSRWLLAPFYLGLVIALGMMLVMFGKQLYHFIPLALFGEENDIIIGVLSLIDVVMTTNLIIIIVFAGYENFVSKIDTADSVDRPSWMGQVGFSELKIKLIGSIMAISGIELLKAFMHVEELTNEHLAWKVGLHMTFVLTGLLFAIGDRVSDSKKGTH